MADATRQAAIRRALEELRARNARLRSPLEAVEACEVVARLQTLEAYDALREVTAPREFDPQLREYAISALSDFKRPEDLAFVISMMRDHYIQDVAQACIQQEWSVEAVDALLARLPDRDDDAMCLVEALGIVGDERALEPLRSLLDSPNESEASFAADAIFAIANRGHAAATESARAAFQAALDWEPPSP
jgi:HEAT repeat protein